MTETSSQHFSSSYCKFVKCGDYRKGDDGVGQKCCQITGYIPGNMPCCPHDMDLETLKKYSDRKQGPMPKPDPRCNECGSFSSCQTHDPEKENCVSKALKLPAKKPLTPKKEEKTAGDERAAAKENLKPDNPKRCVAPTEKTTGCRWWAMCDKEKPYEGCTRDIAREFGAACKLGVEITRCKQCDAFGFCPQISHPPIEKTEKFVQHCCGTCGHHKGRKMFHETCPRLPEMLFIGGTKSAKVLMDETATTPCDHWTDIPGNLYKKEKPQPEARQKKYPYRIRIYFMEEGTPAKESGNPYGCGADKSYGNCSGYGGPAKDRKEVIKMINWQMQRWNQFDSILGRQPDPVNVKTVLFDDETGDFTINDFFNDDGTPKASEPEKPEPTGREMTEAEKQDVLDQVTKEAIEKESQPGGILAQVNPEKLELKMIPEFKNLIPGLSPQEFRGLEDSLQSEGCRDPIVTWKGIIVDGHNRYQICTSLKIPFKTIEREFADETEVKIWIIKNQFSRRNLLPYVRATLAESLKGMITEKAKANLKLSRGRGVKGRENSPEVKIETRDELAKVAGVSNNTISRVEFINQKASDEVKQKLASGEVSINSAYKEIKNPGLFTSETDEWYTPKEIIESVLKVFGGQIDVDPCSNSQEIPNVPAALHFTKEDDGLTKSWFGKVYMNPPYGREIKDWVLKLIEEKEKGNIEEAIALVPARTDTEWFTAFDPHPWCAVKGRLKFSDNPNSAPFPSAIFYLGSDEDLQGLERFFQEFNKHGIIYQTIQQQMEAKNA